MADTKKELFISYGREPETVNFVRLLKRDLEKMGLSVWLDAEDIIAGCDWYSAIGQGLENCSGIIAVITNKYINSHYCKSELYTANNDRKLIFPVIFEDVDFSSSTAAKGVKYIISGINWTMFRPNIDEYSTSLGRLSQGMKEQGLGKVGGADSRTSEDLATEMSHLNVSGNGGAPPPHSFHTPPHALPTAPPPHTYQTPPQPPQFTSPHSGGCQPPPYQYPPYPPNSTYPPPTTYPHSTTYPPYQPSSPHPGYAQPQPGYGYGQPAPSPGYTPPHGYMPPLPSQHPGTCMYVPPVATPQTTPPQGTTDFTDQGPPKYDDIYHPTQPHFTSPQQAPPTPDVEPLPEKPSSASVPAPSQSEAARFKVGMKLEAVDRRFPYFICVATVMDRSDDEVLVHFDGWGDGYDYWCAPDAVELHPPGWCSKNNWELQTPRDQEWHGWDRYLDDTEADRAPDKLFTEGQLAGQGSLLFRAGMSIEAKDRKTPNLVCVATIERVSHDGRLLVHFDGWSDHYNYWCDRASSDIHPPMWCGKNNKRVTPPKGYEGQFKWSEYLTNPGIIPAPAHLFKQEQLSANGGRSSRPPSAESLGQFKVDMKLEAKDRLNPSLIAVATITNIRDGKLLIHFDGWTSRYDYWCKPTSTDIHPVGWCTRQERTLQPPNGYVGQFNWSEYLSKTGTVAAPAHLFKQEQISANGGQISSAQSPGQFKVGMKLEAKDRKYPTLIAVATINNISNGKLLIHFDGWTSEYDYWCETTSTDIHPVGWCARHGRTLQPPKGMDSRFSWMAYLKKCGSKAAPDSAFNSSQK